MLLHSSFCLPLNLMTPIPCRHLIRIGILGIVPGVIRLLAGLVLCAFRILSSTFDSLLTKADYLFLSPLASLDDMTFGLMFRRALGLIAGHPILLVTLGRSNCLLWFVRHNWHALKNNQTPFPNSAPGRDLGQSIFQFY